MKQLRDVLGTLKARDFIDFGLGVVAVLAIVLAAFPLFAPEDIVQFVMAVALSVMAVGFFIAAFLINMRSNVVENQAAKAGRWNSHLSSLSTVVLMAANSAVHRQVEGQSAAFRDQATHVCREFAAMFREVVHRDVRVTLKQIYVPEDEEKRESPRQAVRTMVSVGSRDERSDGVDWVDENSDFDGIITRGETHFFSNDLIADMKLGYRNSHWTRERLAQWAVAGNYPYRSTIVWPVRAQIDPAGESQRWSTVGFLCVDCVDSGVFEPMLDTEIGEIAAQALYGVWPPRTSLPPTSQGAS